MTSSWLVYTITLIFKIDWYDYNAVTFVGVNGNAENVVSQPPEKNHITTLP